MRPITIAAAALAAAALATATLASAQTPPVLPPWPLEGTVAYARALAAATPLRQPTGLKRADYLATVQRNVDFWRAYQNASGNIIDPYRGQETQYATPCFAHACSVLYAAGLDSTLFPNCTSAVTATLLELQYDTCADGHCVFYMYPVMSAYRILLPLVAEGVASGWNASLSAMNPWVDFKWPDTSNWGLVGTMDQMRTKLGFGNSSWWTEMLDAQLSNPTVTETPNGLYQDHSGLDGLNPLPYDTFPTSGYLTTMLREGYSGPWFAFINETTTRAAWTHLLMQSPWGEIPTGGRSSQHTWNEAVSALAYEIEATKYAAMGDAAAACTFRRAARLSHASVRRWQIADGSFRIVKNNFPPTERWGYEEYSYLSNYNLLPSSFLAAAYSYADDDDAIPECSTFADVGGFSFFLPEHHLVIANAGGVYAEIETFADPRYEPMGLHRVHINTCGAGAPGSCVTPHALLTPTAGPPYVFSAPTSTAVAIGPWWSTAADAPGSRTAFAALNFSDIAGVFYQPTYSVGASEVQFSVEYYLLTVGGLVTQSYTVTASKPDGTPAPQVAVTSSVQLIGGAALLARAEANGVRIPAAHVERARALGVMDPDWAATSPAANLTRFGVQFPAFLFDGASNTTVTLAQADNTVTVAGPPGSGWGSGVFSVAPPAANHSYTWSLDLDPSAATASRNGFVATAWVETTFETSSPSFTQYVTGTN